IESSRQYAADEFPELGQGARPRQRGASYVEGQIEVLIIDPPRGAEPRRNTAHPLPIPRHECDPLADEPDQALVLEAPRTRVENVDRTDVAWSVRRIQGQQGNLER